MPCGTKLSSNKKAKLNLTLTPDNLDYIYIFLLSNSLLTTMNKRFLRKPTSD